MKRVVPLFLALILVLVPLHIIQKDVDQTYQSIVMLQLQQSNIPVSRIIADTGAPDDTLFTATESRLIPISVLPNQISDKELIRILMPLLLLLLSVLVGPPEILRWISKVKVPYIRKRIIRSIYFTHGL